MVRQRRVLKLSFACLSSCAGRREFVFHTADVAEFVQRLTNMPQEVERYPIDLLRNNDPDWAYFDAVTPQVGPAGT